MGDFFDLASRFHLLHCANDLRFRGGRSCSSALSFPSSDYRTLSVRIAGGKVTLGLPPKSVQPSVQHPGLDPPDWA